MVDIVQQARQDNLPEDAAFLNLYRGQNCNCGVCLSFLSEQRAKMAGPKSYAKYLTILSWGTKVYTEEEASEKLKSEVQLPSLLSSSMLFCETCATQRNMGKYCYVCGTRLNIITLTV